MESELWAAGKFVKEVGWRMRRLVGRLRAVEDVRVRVRGMFG